MSALVTGATSGIGQAVAQVLGRQDAEVTVNCRDATRGDWFVRPLRLDDPPEFQ